MKKTLLTLLVAGVHCLSFGQTAIPTGDYSVVSYSSAGGTNLPENLFDDDATTFWALGNNNLPGELIIDLGTTYDVRGFQITPRSTTNPRKPRNYELYLSTDGVTWGDPEIISDFGFTETSVSPSDILIGGISAQFAKLIFTSSLDVNENIQTGELLFYEEAGSATGQSNQSILIDPINDMDESAPAFELSASSTSGLPVTLEVISGPATLTGTELELTGETGMVILKASQEGNADFYAANDVFVSFNVVDLSSYLPEIETRISEAYPIEMPELYAYPIYASAKMIDYPSMIDIAEVSAKIDGETYTMYANDGFYFCWWTPADFGAHTIEIIATTSEGAEHSITKNVEVTSAYATQSVLPMEDIVIEFGGENSRWYTGDISLPQFVGAYASINAKLIIECPDGNCDDWDRAAYIEVKSPSGDWIQLIRYMTPYGVGCNHEIDLSEYESILQGDSQIRMFIDTWGTGGWQITLDLEYQEGTPEYLYSSVTELWDGTFNFGNLANLQPMESREISFSENIEKSTLILSTTGHGWGATNTDNAAEFYHAVHELHIDGVETYEQDLWNVCNPNPDECTGQMGTWYYNRAGWCPGAIAHPNKYDFSSHIASGSIQLDYLFEEGYADLCHPNNPDCVTGVTCSDCNAGYNPFYYIDGHIVKYSNTPLLYDVSGLNQTDRTPAFSLAVYPNPSNGMIQLETDLVLDSSPAIIRVFSLSGKQVQSFYFENAVMLENSTFNLSDLSSGLYFVTLETNNQITTSQLVIE